MICHRVQLKLDRTPRPDAHAEIPGAEGDVVARVVGLGAKLNKPDPGVSRYELVTPEVLQ